MDVLATGLAILGGVTGLSGFIVSIRADRRATRADKRAAAADVRAVRAEEEGKRARQRELWTEVIGAAQDLTGAVVVYQDLRPLLVRLRIARTELVDGIQDAHYKQLGEWMAVDHVVLAKLFDSTMRKIEGQDCTLEQLEQAHRPAHDWVAAFVVNLRIMRQLEPGPEAERQIEELLAAAHQAHEHLDGDNLRMQDVV